MNYRSCFFACVLVAAVLTFAGCGTGETSKPLVFKSVLETTSAESAGIPPGLISAAREDHITLLEAALKKYEAMGIKDYTCKFRKQERIRGKLQKKQVMRVKFMVEPFSIAMHWEKNPPAGDAMLYVEGERRDKNGRSRMLVRPRDPIPRFIAGGSVLKLPDCREAKKNSLRPCTKFGFRNGLEMLLEYYRIAKKQDEIEMSCGGATDVGGRKCIVLVRVIPKKTTEIKTGNEVRVVKYPAKTSETCLDIETLMPIRVVGYDWENRLLCTYEFLDVKFNTGLTSADFTPKANGIKP